MRLDSLLTIGLCFALSSAVTWAADASNASSAASPAAAQSPAKKAKSSAAKPTTATTLNPSDEVAAKSNDRLTLDPTVVSGNRELPKVMYIVPWKKADLGNLPGQPFNSLLDEALTPVDRDVFRREVQYYDAIAAKDQPDFEQATQKTDSK